MTASMPRSLLEFHSWHMRGIDGVQAAEFLGCKDVKNEIINHLQTVLMETVQRNEGIVAPDATMDSDLSIAVDHAFTRDWRNVQVRTCNALLLLSELE
jgi:hypothetical protein